MMENIVAFKTSDGTLFETKEQAERHELFLAKESIIEEFLDSKFNPYTGHAQIGMARQTIVNWELWKSRNEIASE
jgi:hypothetical protein